MDICLICHNTYKYLQVLYNENRYNITFNIKNIKINTTNYSGIYCSIKRSSWSYFHDEINSIDSFWKRWPSYRDTSNFLSRYPLFVCFAPNDYNILICLRASWIILFTLVQIVTLSYHLLAFKQFLPVAKGKDLNNPYIVHELLLWSPHQQRLRIFVILILTFLWLAFLYSEVTKKDHWLCW